MGQLAPLRDGDAAEAAVLKAIAGEVEAAAAAAVAAVNAELKSGGPWNAPLLTRLLAALGLLSLGSNAAKSIDPKVRAEVGAVQLLNFS
jgi:hypothetical protein